MKSIEKLQRVVNAIRDVRGQENEATVKFACNLINEFLIDNETAPKGKADLFDICKRTENQYLPLTGVFHDAEHEMAVSTDAHILVATKADYNPEFAGKIVDKYGNEIKDKYGNKFPNWMSIIPSPEKQRYYYDTEITLDANVYRRALKEDKAWRKMHGAKGSKYRTPIKLSDVGHFASADLLLLASFFCGSLKANSLYEPLFYRDDEKIVFVMPMVGPEHGEDTSSYTAFSLVAENSSTNYQWHPLF